MKIDNDDEQEVQVIAPTVQAATTAGVGGRGHHDIGALHGMGH